MTASASVVHWFRRDLRTADNRALNHAISLAKKAKVPLIPVFVIDPEFHSPSACGAVRMRFILESVAALQKSLEKKCGSRLRVASGRAVDVIPEVARKWRAGSLCFEHEYSPAEKARDEMVASDVEALGISVARRHGFMLYEPATLLADCSNGEAPTGMTSFLALVDRVGDPDEPVAFADGQNTELEKCSADVLANDERDGHFKIPNLVELEYEDEDGEDREGWEKFAGGEEEGLKRMDAFLAREGGKEAARFAKPDTSPAAISPRQTTVLSPYLALGCVSSRIFHKRLRELEARFKVAAQPQTRLWGQLMWREHFWLLAGVTPNFHHMRGNPLCRQIDWREGDDASEYLAAWAEARTGYPWIDALMMQLRKEGFVHHLGRHSLACFLTRGDLYVSWEEGYKVFEHFLIDYDYAMNSANWMWLSCSAFFTMYFRVYSPVAFAKKWDKDGEFVRHYLPVLAKMPTKYIHEPWKAPAEVQKKARCVVGKDYPERIVEHGKASKENIAKIKAAYARMEYGVPDEFEGGVSEDSKRDRQEKHDGTKARSKRQKK